MRVEKCKARLVEFDRFSYDLDVIPSLNLSSSGSFLYLMKPAKCETLTEVWVLISSVSWLRVLLFASAISTVCLNILGGQALRISLRHTQRIDLKHLSSIALRNSAYTGAEPHRFVQNGTKSSSRSSSPIPTGKIQRQGSSRVPSIPFTSRPRPGGFANAPELSVPLEKSVVRAKPLGSTLVYERVQSLFHVHNSTIVSPQPTEEGRNLHNPLGDFTFLHVNATDNTADHSAPSKQAIELLFSASVPRNCSVASTEQVEVGDQKGGGCGTLNTSTGESDEVHVVMALDNNYLRGALATMNSVHRNALCPGRILFHFPVTVDEAGQHKLKGVIHKHLPTLRFHMYPFKDSHARNLISRAMRFELSDSLNYARIYMNAILPSCVRRLIYLDTDLIMRSPVESLWNLDLHGHVIGTPEFCKFKVMRYFNTQFWTDKALSGEVEHLQSKCYFNPGVMLVNLDAWRQNKIENKIEHWMNIQHNVMRIYELGSLPPMLLALAGDVEPIPNSWNKHDLGGPCREFNVEAADIMHWSGDGKPWRRLGHKYACEFDREWEKYDIKI